MASTGYIIDLSGATFDDDGRSLWVHALPLGTYKHPLYGTIKVDADRIKRFCSNVKNGVRGQKLDIDYDHKKYSGKAAGWVEDADAREDGLWIKVEWTEDAASAIKKGEYKYFSPELMDEWKNPKTGESHKDVLFGGGLTNRPFLKDLLPLNMSEIHDGEVTQVDKFLEELRKALKLDEDATEEEILKAAAEASEPEEETEETEDEETEETEESEEGIDEQQLSELIKDNPVIAALVKQNKQLSEKVGDLVTTQKLAETNTLLAGWNGFTEGRRFAMPPAVNDDLRAVFLAEPNDKLIGVIDHILEHGLVELGERAGDRGDPVSGGGGGSATKKFKEAVGRKQKEDDKLSFQEAAGMVAAEDPDLFEAYRQEALTDQKGA